MKVYFSPSGRFAFVMAGALGLSLFSGCTGGGSEVLDRVTQAVDDLTNGDEKVFRPTCGVAGDSLRESAGSKEGVFLAQPSALEPNVVAGNPGGGPVVVKLLSLDFSSDSPERAASRLNELVSNGVYLFQRSEPCSIVTPAGAAGTSGQLISPDGIDIAEQLVREGLGGLIVGTGDCGEEMLAPCYESLRPSATE